MSFSDDWTLTKDENVLEKIKSILHKKNKTLTKIEGHQQKEYDFYNDKNNRVSSQEHSLGCSVGRLNGLESERRNNNILLQMIDGWEKDISRVKDFEDEELSS